MAYRLISLMLLSAGLSACNWVDSKGNQNNSGNQLRTIVDGGQLPLLEGTPSTATLISTANNLTNWQWQSVGTNTNGGCAANDGFDNELAADTLRQACTDSRTCEIQIEEQSANGTTEFLITAPALKSPVAINYTVVANDDQGNAVSLDQTLCLISINEAPFAGDDEYTVLQNLRREIKATDPGNLLGNDRDDIDVRNQPLRVIPTPLQAPQHADLFQLGTDGSFIYHPATTENTDVIVDEFIYQITDGIHTTSAKVTLNIVANNRAPIRSQRTTLLAMSVEEHAEIGLRVNLAENFFDPDGDTLSFRIAEGSLPASGNISLTSEGILLGKPQLTDVGDYIVTVLASDGVGQAADTFILSISRFSRQNSAPEVDDIPNRTVSTTFSYNIADFFSDEDDDQLQFTATGLPSGVTMTTSGLIRGTASSSNRGAWFVLVMADDGRGGSTSDWFRLRIR
ncbi:MAG: Ig-like domain-containing protein [Granulosicoccaceae bacterium]